MGMLQGYIKKMILTKAFLIIKSLIRKKPEKLQKNQIFSLYQKLNLFFVIVNLTTLQSYFYK